MVCLLLLLLFLICLNIVRIRTSSKAKTIKEDINKLYVLGKSRPELGKKFVNKIGMPILYINLDRSPERKGEQK